jgi:hypothetical protein
MTLENEIDKEFNDALDKMVLEDLREKARRIGISSSDNSIGIFPGFIHGFSKVFPIRKRFVSEVYKSSGQQVYRDLPTYKQAQALGVTVGIACFYVAPAIAIGYLFYS